MQHIEAIVNLYMHEIAMHHNHNIDDFKPPFNIAPEAGHEEPEFVTPAHIESLTACQESIHNAFDAFLALEPKVIRCLPTIFFVRNSYAAVALIKMYSAVSARGSKFGSIFRPEDLKVEFYLDALIAQFSKVSEGNQSRVAQKFSFIFNMLKSWHMKRSENGSGVPSKQHRNAPDVYRGAPNQDPNSANWHNQSVNINTKRPHSGLQMLSDAAMGKNASSASDPASAAAAALAANPNERYGNAEMGQMPLGTGTGLTPNAGGGMMDYGFVDPSYNNFGFTADDLNAMGNVMDDASWMSFPMEQGGGWAF